MTLHAVMMSVSLSAGVCHHQVHVQPADTQPAVQSGLWSCGGALPGKGGQDPHAHLVRHTRALQEDREEEVSTPTTAGGFRGGGGRGGRGREKGRV